MNLLVVNYEMSRDSDVLAWQAAVVSELAQRVSSVTVLTERAGSVDLPGNVVVHQIPRRPAGVPRRAGGGFLVNRWVHDLCRAGNIDACFVHMAHQWAYRLYPALRLLRIPILLWYAHGTVTAGLRVAHRCADRVVTSTPQGFRLASGKLAVIGQGVDADLFRPPPGGLSGDDVLYVGRVSRRKRVDRLIDVMDHIRRTDPGAPVRLRIVGPVITLDDVSYDRELRAQVWNRDLADAVELIGFVPQRHLPAFYRESFLHLSLSETGSLDKGAVEALAAGCPVLTSNPAFRQLLSPFGELMLDDGEPSIVAERVLQIHRSRSSYDRAELRALVVGHHDLGGYAERVVELLFDLCR